MERPENPPAFPHESYDADADMDTVKTGMSLRDWFAGQAITMCLKDMSLGYGDWAREAYAVADAMLAERAKREGGCDADA